MRTKDFFCGPKGKFGLNCQAVFGVCGRILDISIGLPGASSIAFEGSDLNERLEGGILKNGLVLYGDNAYINTRYMATPFPNVSSGCKDDYIFFSVSAAHPCQVHLWTIGQQVGNSEKCHSIEHYHCADSFIGKLLGTAT